MTDGGLNPNLAVMQGKQAQPLPKTVPAVLNSWKEISAFVGRGIRTAQRWERSSGMPVHRIGHGNRAPVYVVVSELNFWMTKTCGNADGVMQMPLDRKAGRTPRGRSHDLAEHMSTLARLVAESCVRQREQAELLQQRIMRLRSRVQARPGSTTLVFLPTRVA